jgi:hypothetical protein
VGEGGLRLAVSKHLVEDNVVVRRPCCPLNCGVRLEEEVPISGFGDTAVHDRAVRRVGGAVRVFFSGRIEARVMSFADNDDGYPWEVGFSAGGWVDLSTGFAEERQFWVQYEVILSFRDTVTVDEDVVRVFPTVALRPELKTRLEHVIQRQDHFLSGGLTS